MRASLFCFFHIYFRLFAKYTLYLPTEWIIYVFKYFRLQITFRFIFLAMNFLQNTKYYLYVLLACCLIACSDDKNDKDGDDTGDYTDSPLTPDENKAKLETIGKEFVAKINASDHETVVKSLNNLTDAIDGSNFEDLLPDNLQGDDEDYPIDDMIPAQLLQVIKNNDANALMQLATKAMDDDEYHVSDLEGVYIYDAKNHEWKKDIAQNKVELRYTVEGVASVFTADFSGIKDYTKVDGVIVEVPAKTEVSLTVNGAKVMNFVTNIELSNDMYSAKINSTLSLNDDYSWNITADVKSEKVTSTFKMTVKGEELINGSVEVNGTKMTDPDNIEKNEEDILNNGKIDFTIMNIRLQGEGDIKAIMNGLDKIEDIDPWDDDFTEAASKANAEKEMKLYNDYMKIAGFYVKEKQKFVDVKMAIYSEEEEVYIGWDQVNGSQFKTVNAWYVQPILVFTDKSEVEFDTFFTETRFSSLISSVETLINKYTAMVGADKVEL